MGLLMSGGVGSKLNFVGEVLKGCDERSWLGLDIQRDGSCFFVPTLMTVHRTHLLFHLSGDWCWHSAFGSVPTCFLLLNHLNIHIWSSQSCTDFCFERVWGLWDKTAFHGLALCREQVNWAEPWASLPMFHGESRRALPYLAQDVHPCNKKSTQEVKSSLKRVGTWGKKNPNLFRSSSRHWGLLYTTSIPFSGYG